MEAAANDGAYVLRDLMRNAPLSPDGEEEHNVYITCVDAWGESRLPEAPLLPLSLTPTRWQLVYWYIGRRDSPLRLNSIPRLGPTHVHPRVTSTTRTLQQAK
jgi:hypothetical protein